MEELELREKVDEFCDLQQNCSDCPLNELSNDIGYCPSDNAFDYTEEVKSKILELITVKPSNQAKPQEETKQEEINHPSRYAGGKYECINVMLDVFGKEAVKHFCLLNAFKYIWRQEHKGGTEDIKKAVWYLNECIELEESEVKDES